MDVSCPRCKTDYEFDDARVPDAGVTVKCTQCSHVFRVRKKSVPAPVSAAAPAIMKPGDETEPGLPRHAPAQREWKVRQPSGNVFSFKELTTLQKWIVERKVSRDDEISLTGEAWKRLGNIAELASFFQVVDDAKKVQELEALQQMQQKLSTKPEVAPAPPAPPPLPVQHDEPSGPKAVAQSGAVPAPGERAGVLTMPVEATSFPARTKPSGNDPPTLPPDAPAPPPLRQPRAKLTETLRDPGFTMPPPRGNEDRPAPYRAPPPPREMPSELVEMQSREFTQDSGGSNAGVWIGLLLVLLGIGGAAGWYFVVYVPEQQRQKELADIQQRVKSDEDARLKTEEAAKAETDRKAKEEKDAADKKKKEDEEKALSAALAASKDAGVRDAGTVAEATPTGTGTGSGTGQETKDKKPAGCKSADCFISQGDRLRDRERAEAALDAYGKALDLKPDNVEALTGKGLCYLDMAKPALAEPMLEQALKMNPRYAPAIMGLAESYRFQGKKDAAVAMYQKYLDSFPNGPEAGVAKSNIDRLK
jgi:predicted Zn finger-like uncharacterized protein